MTVDDSERKAVHSYPRELVDFLREHWEDPDLSGEASAREKDGPPDRLPGEEILDQLISTCYQSSLMREEERSINFRLILRGPERFAPEEGPPEGFHRLLFTASRPFSEYELRRLSPAADFYRSLIGIQFDPAKGLLMWGMVYSGPRWIHSIFGGRKVSRPLPPSLVIHVTGPGRVTVCRGSTVVATLNGGQINSPSMDVFESGWIAESFADARNDFVDRHLHAREQAGRPWANLEENFIRTLAKQVVKRIINTIRNSRHGGTIVYLPPEQAAELCCSNHYMTVKYQFAEEEPRMRFRTLMVKIMNTFAEIAADGENAENIVGWHDYVNMNSENIALLDESLFEFAHMVAGLAAIDGAVIVSKRHEVLGFGAVISGDIDKVETVAKALDIGGDVTVQVRSEEVGTRHRAAYRLCYELHDALAIVISQDGTVRVIKWHNGQVTYWDQVPSGVLGY